MGRDAHVDEAEKREGGHAGRKRGAHRGQDPFDPLAAAGLPLGLGGGGRPIRHGPEGVRQVAPRTERQDQTIVGPKPRVRGLRREIGPETRPGVAGCAQVRLGLDELAMPVRIGDDDVVDMFDRLDPHLDDVLARRGAVEVQQLRQEPRRDGVLIEDAVLIGRARRFAHVVRLLRPAGSRRTPGQTSDPITARTGVKRHPEVRVPPAVDRSPASPSIRRRSRALGHSRRSSGTTAPEPEQLHHEGCRAPAEGERGPHC